MHANRLACLAIMLPIAFPNASCAPSPALLSSLPPPLEIGPGYTLDAQDKIRLNLYGDQEFSGEYRVAPDGAVSLPLIGSVQASGKKIDELRDEITARLASGYYTDPRLTAEISEFRPFYIYGEISRPGNYPYVPELTLARAIAIAGGYTYRANPKTILIQRRGSQKVYRVRVDQTFRLAPGDTIKILERYF